jgi:hypothetical protein
MGDNTESREEDAAKNVAKIMDSFVVSGGLTPGEHAMALATEIGDYLSIAIEPYELNYMQQLAVSRIKQAIKDGS